MLRFMHCVFRNLLRDALDFLPIADALSAAFLALPDCRTDTQCACSQ
jgi:hypothetical protein